MDEQGRLGVKRCAERGTAQQRGPFRDAQPVGWKSTVERVRVECSRKFGGPWLELDLLRRLELGRFFGRELARGAGRNSLATDGHGAGARTAVRRLQRTAPGGTVLRIQCALADLLSLPAEKVNEDRLYWALDALLPHKPALEKHLKEKLGELFELDYDLVLYDVTSIYFEGRAEKNPQAPARLFARPSAGLQTGQHRARSEPMRDAAGL